MKQNEVTCAMTKSFIVNFLLSVFKVISGVLFHSQALIADGIHSFSDLITDIVAIIGAIIARRPADDKHPLGHGKIEYITSLFISIIILLLGFKIIFDSNHDKTSVNILITLVCIITIIAKWLLSGYIINEGKKHNNNILIASGLESKTDVISSIVVLISGIFMYLSKYINILKYSDFIATIIVGIFIVRVGFNSLRINLSAIIGEAETNEEYINIIKNIILENKTINRIDKFILLKYGYSYKLICEVGINSDVSLKDAHDAVHKVEKNIKKYDKKIEFITFHINPI